MRVLRTAAVLILLALSLGTSAFAAKARPEVPSRPSRAAARSAAGVFAPLWRLAVDGLTKAGCTINPWGQCGASAQTQDAEAGCGTDPLGRCSAGR